MITAVGFYEQPIPLSQSVTHTASITILPDTTGSKKTGEVGKIMKFNKQGPCWLLVKSTLYYSFRRP